MLLYQSYFLDRLPSSQHQAVVVDINLISGCIRGIKNVGISCLRIFSFFRIISNFFDVLAINLENIVRRSVNNISVFAGACFLCKAIYTCTQIRNNNGSVHSAGCQIQSSACIINAIFCCFGNRRPSSCRTARAFYIFFKFKFISSISVESSVLPVIPFFL